MVSGKALNAYVAAGIKNDHECSTVAELKRRIACGMYVLLREGTVTQNLTHFKRCHGQQLPTLCISC